MLNSFRLPAMAQKLKDSGFGALKNYRVRGARPKPQTLDPKDPTTIGLPRGLVAQFGRAIFLSSGMSGAGKAESRPRDPILYLEQGLWSMIRHNHVRTLRG